MGQTGLPSLCLRSHGKRREPFTPPSARSSERRLSKTSTLSTEHCPPPSSSSQTTFTRVFVEVCALPCFSCLASAGSRSPALGESGPHLPLHLEACCTVSVPRCKQDSWSEAAKGRKELSSPLSNGPAQAEPGVFKHRLGSSLPDSEHSHGSWVPRPRLVGGIGNLLAACRGRVLAGCWRSFNNSFSRGKNT